jgi:SPP1 family phage portal protein
MDIEVIKKLIRKYQSGHTDFVRRTEKTKAYYRNETDIMFPPLKEEQEKKEKPLRNADNRIPFNFHGLLVNQKASYMFAAPPIFDLGNKETNKKLTQFLGDKYPKVCKDLCIEASNCTVAWLHVWKDGKGAWKYAVVPAEQIIPVWTSDLEKELSGVFRSYQNIDEETGDRYTVYEYWNDKECTAYRLKAGDELDQLMPYQMFLVDPELCEYSDCYQHGVGEVPFFPFFNNNIDTDDLKNIKPLIDTYCKVFSGFVNDLEDIQEVIFVLTNYGGEDLGQFLRDLKDYKAIQIESDGDGDHSGVSTLTIELPVEAREKLLEITRKGHGYRSGSAELRKQFRSCAAVPVLPSGAESRPTGNGVPLRLRTIHPVYLPTSGDQDQRWHDRTDLDEDQREE